MNRKMKSQSKPTTVRSKANMGSTTRSTPKYLWILTSSFYTGKVAPRLKFVLGLAAFCTAITTIAAFWPTATNTVFPRIQIAANLQSLHAGYSLDAFKEKLGTATMVKEVRSNPRITEYRFISTESIASAFTDTAGQVLIYSVLSCSSDFSLAFTTPSGSKATLQSTPISHSETGPGYQYPTEKPFDYNARNITYFPGGTGGSLNQIIEQGVFSGSTQARKQNYYLGINSACAKWGYGSESPLNAPYEGEALNAPKALQDLRDTIAPNFYAETSGIEVKISAEDQVWIQKDGIPLPDAGSHQFPISPYHLEIPQDFLARGSTKHFR